MKTIRDFWKRIVHPIWQICKEEDDQIVIITYIGRTEFRITLLPKATTTLEVYQFRVLKDFSAAKEFRNFI